MKTNNIITTIVSKYIDLYDRYFNFDEQTSISINDNGDMKIKADKDTNLVDTLKNTNPTVSNPTMDIEAFEELFKSKGELHKNLIATTIQSADPHDVLTSALLSYGIKGDLDRLLLCEVILSEMINNKRAGAQEALLSLTKTNKNDSVLIAPKKVVLPVAQYQKYPAEYHIKAYDELCKHDHFEIHEYIRQAKDYTQTICYLWNMNSKKFEYISPMIGTKFSKIITPFEARSMFIDQIKTATTSSRSYWMAYAIVDYMLKISKKAARDVKAIELNATQKDKIAKLKATTDNSIVEFKNYAPVVEMPIVRRVDKDNMFAKHYIQAAREYVLQLPKDEQFTITEMNKRLQKVLAKVNLDTLEDMMRTGKIKKIDPKNKRSKTWKVII